MGCNEKAESNVCGIDLINQQDRMQNASMSLEAGGRS